MDSEDEGHEEGEGAIPMDVESRELETLVGQFKIMVGEVEDHILKRLLQSAKGDLSAAVNLYFDELAKPKKAKSPKKQATLSSFFGSKDGSKKRNQQSAPERLSGAKAVKRHRVELLETDAKEAQTAESNSMRSVTVDDKPSQSSSTSAFLFGDLADTFEEVIVFVYAR